MTISHLWFNSGDLLYLMSIQVLISISVHKYSMHNTRTLTAARKPAQQEAVGRARKAFGRLYGGLVEVPRSVMRAYRRGALEKSIDRALESLVLQPETVSARLNDIEEEIAELEGSLQPIRRLDISLKKQRELEKTKNVPDDRVDALRDEIKELEHKCESILAQTSAEMELEGEMNEKLYNIGRVLATASLFLILPDFVNGIHHLSPTMAHSAFSLSTWGYIGFAGIIASIPVLSSQLLLMRRTKKATLVKRAKDHVLERIACLEVDREILEEQNSTNKRLMGQ